MTVLLSMAPCVGRSGAKNETFKMCFENVNETEKMVFFSGFAS